MSKLFFIDTANLDEIKKWYNRGMIDGVTTNQKIFFKEGHINFKKRVIDICKYTKKPVSVELTNHSSIVKMLEEAKEYISWDSNVVIKVPMTLDGICFDVVNTLKKNKVATNTTLIVTAEQAMLAIKAGATYVSVFFNRAKEAGYDPIENLIKVRKFIDNGEYKTKIITGSIRTAKDIGESFLAGSDIVTIPPCVLYDVLQEEMTQKIQKEFDEDWSKFIGYEK